MPHPSIDDPRSSLRGGSYRAGRYQRRLSISDSDEELASNLEYSEYYKSIGEAGNLINLNMGVDPLADDFERSSERALDL